jgi:hypothetical protein
MRISRKYLEHGLSVVFVGLVFYALIVWTQSGERSVRQKEYESVAPYLNVPSLDLSRPMHRALLRETLRVYAPDAPERADSLVSLAQKYALMDYAELQKLLRSGAGLTWEKLGDLANMYGVFIMVYLVILGLTFYGVQTLGVWQFVQEKQGATSYLAAMIRVLRSPSPTPLFQRILTALWLIAKAAGRGIGLLILFSPAYVLAYSFRSRFDTDTLFFMALFGALSNGLLITYARKFHTFLVAESRKGYVETATVKNLTATYTDFPTRWMLRIRKDFPGHVFGHIYINARHQYILTLKEQASFLITGLIIIEMALNIHGHLCYELLQNILYERWDIVLVILFGIFAVVKGTEIAVDMWMDRETARYENR